MLLFLVFCIRCFIILFSILYWFSCNL